MYFCISIMIHICKIPSYMLSLCLIVSIQAGLVQNRYLPIIIFKSMDICIWLMFRKNPRPRTIISLSPFHGNLLAIGLFQAPWSLLFSFCSKFQLFNSSSLLWTSILQLQLWVKTNSSSLFFAPSFLFSAPTQTPSQLSASFLYVLLHRNFWSHP